MSQTSTLSHSTGAAGLSSKRLGAHAARANGLPRTGDAIERGAGLPQMRVAIALDCAWNGLLAYRHGRITGTPGNSNMLHSVARQRTDIVRMLQEARS